MKTPQETPPPLGLVPRWVRDTERVHEILEAICRYVNAGVPVPREWIEELAEKTTTTGETR